MKNNQHIKGSFRLILVLLLMGCIAITVVITGLLARNANSIEVSQWTQERLLPTVSVTKPENNETSDDQEISKVEEEQDFKESDEECQLSNQNSSTTSEKVELTATTKVNALPCAKDQTRVNLFTMSLRHRAAQEPADLNHHGLHAAADARHRDPLPAVH